MDESSNDRPGMAEALRAFVEAVSSGDRGGALSSGRQIANTFAELVDKMPVDSSERAVAVSQLEEFLTKLREGESGLAESIRSRAENLEVSGIALQRAAAARAHYDAVNDTHRVALLNVAQFALLWNIDLVVLLDELETPNGAWHERLHARLLALTLFECFEDFGALLGGAFRRNPLVTANPTSIGTLNALRARLAAFRSEHGTALKAVRITVVGHREHDASIQLQQLEALDSKAIRALGYQLMGWTTDLYAYLNPMLSP